MKRLDLSPGGSIFLRLTAGWRLLITAFFATSCLAGDICPPQTLRGALFRQNQQEEFRALGMRLMEQTLPEWYEIAASLSRRCAPPDCLIVGVGRSPTVLIGMLQEMHPGTNGARNLPFSFRERGFDSQGYPAGLTAVGEMIQRQLGDDQARNAKRIVLIDFVSSGESLFQAGRLTRGKLRSLGSKAEFELIGMTDNSSMGHVLKRMNANESQPFKYSDMFAPEDTSMQWLDHIAEYPKFIPGHTPVNEVLPDPRFEEVRKRIRDWLKSSGKIK